MLFLSTLTLMLQVPALRAQSLPSPVFHYDFDTRTGTTSGSAAWTTNTPSGGGSALDLSSGQAGYLDASSSASEINGLSKLTITLWVNLQASPLENDRLFSSLASSVGLDFRICNPVSGTLSASNFGLTLQVNGASNASIQMGNNHSVNANNQWVFLAVTYDGTSVRFFAGGSEQNASVSPLGNGTVPLSGGVVGSSTKLYIGATPATTADRTPPALIDDVRVYDSVLNFNLGEIEQVRLLNLSQIPESSTVALSCGIITLAIAAFLCRRHRRG